MNRLFCILLTFVLAVSVAYGSIVHPVTLDAHLNGYKAPRSYGPAANLAVDAAHLPRTMTLSDFSERHLLPRDLVQRIAATYTPQYNIDNGACGCGFNYTALALARIAVGILWIERVNGNLTHYNDVIYTYLIQNSSLTIEGYGTFHELEVIREYGLVIFPESGIAVGKLFNALDLTSFKFLNYDVLSAVYENRQWSKDKVTGVYNPTLNGLMNGEYMQFVPCSHMLVSSYVKQDPDSVKRGQQQFASTTMAAVCGLVSAGCTPTGRFPYASMADCITYMSSLGQTQCPFVITGDTAICRNFHALNALADPAVHCPHTSPHSEMCQESCLPDCGPAIPNTFCDTDFYNITIPHYKRKCSPGYIGDGHTCTPVSCTQRYQCPGPYSYSTCNTNTSLCQCLDSFVWNSVTGTCACPADQNVVWLSSGKPFCVPNGRCITRSDCPQAKAGAYSDVTCVTPVNAFATSNFCRCNYGFDGMFANQCTCNGGKQVKWSDFYQGNVCLASTECTETWHCPWGKACYMNNTDTIGQCA